MESISKRVTNRYALFFWSRAPLWLAFLSDRHWGHITSIHFVIIKIIDWLNWWIDEFIESWSNCFLWTLSFLLDNHSKITKIKVDGDVNCTLFESISTLLIKFETEEKFKEIEKKLCSYDHPWILFFIFVFRFPFFGKDLVCRLVSILRS